MPHSSPPPPTPDTHSPHSSLTREGPGTSLSVPQAAEGWAVSMLNKAWAKAAKSGRPGSVLLHRIGGEEPPGPPGTLLCPWAQPPSPHLSHCSHSLSVALPALPLPGALAGPSPAFPSPCPSGASPCLDLPGACLEVAPLTAFPTPVACMQPANVKLRRGALVPRWGWSRARLEGALPAWASPLQWGPAPWPCSCRPGSVAQASGWGRALLYLDAASVFADPHPPPPGSSVVELRVPGRGLCGPLGPEHSWDPAGTEPSGSGVTMVPATPNPMGTPRRPAETSCSPPAVWGMLPGFGGWWVGTESSGFPAPPASPFLCVGPSGGGNSQWVGSSLPSSPPPPRACALRQEDPSPAPRTPKSHPCPPAFPDLLPPPGVHVLSISVSPRALPGRGSGQPGAGAISAAYSHNLYPRFLVCVRGRHTCSGGGKCAVRSGYLRHD